MLFAYDSHALLGLLAFFSSERSQLIRKHTVGLFGEIVHWLQLTQQMTPQLQCCDQVVQLAVDSLTFSSSIMASAGYGQDTSSND